MTNPRNKILVIRLSAMGDVAMTVPVLDSLARKEDVELYMLTPKAFAPMFASVPNLTIIPFDKTTSGNFSGIIRLFSELKKYHFDFVADLHDVLRTKLIRLLFSLSGIKTAKIDKGRSEKQALVKYGKDRSAQLKTSFERYRDVFLNLGFQFEIAFDSIFENKPELPDIFGIKKGKWIGIAPFAKHQGKIYPSDKMEKVIEIIDKQDDISIFLFGGKEEKEIMQAWADKYDSIRLMPESARLTEELILMSHLDVMLSMDSANMHLASLVGIPVISIWGATHRFAGFLGWNQESKNIVEIDDLSCRPCSVFGDKPCRRLPKDYACMNWITPERIVEEINSFIA
jgi:ADP-heptose:LPS heptosyltransferase